MKKIIKKHYVTAVFVLIAVIYCFSYFFQHKIPFPSSYVANNLAPWSAYFGGGPIKNGIPDVPSEIYPMRSLVVDFWKQGIIPLWNPHILSGTPFLANFQSAVFFPLNLIFLFFPKVHAWSILILLQPFIAGIFMFLYLKSLRISNVSRLFSSISFMFCGYLTVWGSYGTLGYAILFLPLALFFIEEYFQKNIYIYLPLISVVICFSFFAGHIQTWLYLYLAVIVYSLIKAFLIKELGIKKKMLLFLFIFLAIPLSAVQFLPTLEFYSQSGRLLLKNSYTLGIPPQYFITLIAPDFFGNPVTRNDWFGTYAEWSGYAGFTALIMAFLAFVSLKNEKKVFPIIGVGVIGIILAVHNPILVLFSKLPIPILSNSNPARIIVLFTFCISVLSGFGLDLLSNYFEKVKKIFIKILVSLSMLMFGLGFLTLYGQYFFTRFVGENLRLVSFRNILMPMAILIIIWVLFSLTRINIKFRKFLIFGILLLCVFEMLRFYLKWTPFDSIKLFYPDTKVVDFLKRDSNYSRYYGQFAQAPAYINHLYSLEGYEPLNLLSYGSFINSANSGKLSKDYLLDVKLQSRDKFTKRVLDLLGVKYLIYNANDARSSFVFPVWNYDSKSYPLSYKDDKYIVINNTEALPRVKLFSEYVVTDSDDKAVLAVYGDKFDYQNTLVLDSDPNFEQGALSTGSAEILIYQPNKILISTLSDKFSLLFLSDNYFPGWKAYVNNREVKIYKADYSFRAVIVPKGKNIVEFRYDPASFRIGFIITCVALFIIFSLWSLLRKKK